jgi:hypothetical protein
MTDNDKGRERMGHMDERLQRQARNEALVREVNERMEALDREAAGSGAVDGVRTFGFHCECGRNDGCPEMIWMTLDEYEVVRREDDRFALAPGHETEELERVVDGNERYVIVDKLDPVEPLVADDPRGRPSG